MTPSLATPTPAVRRRRWLVMLAAAAGLGALAVWLALRDPDPQPVRETTLEKTGVLRVLTGNGWRNLPFRLTAEEEQSLADLQRLARQIRTTTDGHSEFDTDATRQQLDQLRRRRPAFYAEYLLGLWHQRHGDADASRR